MNRMKLFIAISILLVLFTVPMSFAADVETAVQGGDAVENMALASGGSSEILAADYYFDSNAEDDDGDGSALKPYKEFKSSRVASNSTLYLADGEYTLDKSVYIDNVSIIGQNPSKTILKYRGTGFTVSSSLTLKNLTLVNLRISNNGNMTATNTIFQDYRSTSYNGGIIESRNEKSFINLYNCTFNNTSAKMGGAIYQNHGTLTIADSLFANAHADSYGGAIAGDDADIFISNSKFQNSGSAVDAGGAIYLMKSKLNASNLEIINCTSSFGGAITSLNSNLALNNFTGKSNRAKYDGGAIYSLYGEFDMDDSLLENNSAENAGAIFVYNAEIFLIKNTQFIRNQANNHAGAFYSVFLPDPYYDSVLDEALHNTFLDNQAPYENDVLEMDVPVSFIGNGDCLFVSVNITDVTSIPVKYDLRALGQVSSVKNQGNEGNCWAFATLSALESSILKATGMEFDLSEENLKDLMALYSIYGWNLDTNNGGTESMGYSYIVSWLGPVNESDDEYRLNAVLSPVLNSLMHVQNILFLKRDNYTDNDGVKLAVMKYGGVATSLAMYNKYLKDKKYYYCSGNDDLNHMGVIVGWDDDLEIPGAPAKGAWIVKNTWGPTWGENGFYYVSYYDTKFAKIGTYNSYVFVLNDTLKYDKNYQYDIPGKSDIFLNESNVLWYKNRFTATDDEYLAAVSTYFDKDTEWDLSIYVNGKTRLKQSGFASASYMTIELDKMIQLKKGDVFEVEFKITVDDEASLPISEYITQRSDNNFYINTRFYTENISFVSYDGKNWKDLYNLKWQYGSHIYYSQVACIKAFTVLDRIKTSIELEALNGYNPVQLRAVVKNQYGALVKSGKVTFSVGSNNIDVDVKDGIASVACLFDDIGTKTITATFKATGYVSSSDSIQVIVDNLPTALTSSDVVATYNSSSNIVATLKDLYGNAVVGARVKIAVGSIEKTLTTDSKGKVYLSVGGLLPDEYTATFTFDANNIYKGSSATSHVIINKWDTGLKANDITADYRKGGDIVATLKDSNGKAVSGVKIAVGLNGANSTFTTDDDGKVHVPTVDLLPGEYAVTFAFAGSEIYGSADANSRVVINKLKSNLDAVDVITVYNHDDCLNVTLTDVDGNAIGGAQVNVVLGGVAKSLTTDKKGKLSLTTNGIVPNSYVATITYGGDRIYEMSNTSASVVINKEKSKIFLRNALYFVLQTKMVKVTLWDGNNNPLVGKTVYIKLDQYTWKYYGVTDENGTATIKVGVGFGTHGATVGFDGDENYTGTSKTGSIRVIKETPSLMLPGAYTKFAASDRLKIVKIFLKDRYDKPLLLGTKVFLKINGQIYNGVIDSEGAATINLNIYKTGTYAVDLIYTGNTAYNEVRKSTKIFIV